MMEVKAGMTLKRCRRMKGSSNTGSSRREMMGCWPGQPMELQAGTRLYYMTSQSRHSSSCTGSESDIIGLYTDAAGLRRRREASLHVPLPAIFR